MKVAPHFSVGLAFVLERPVPPGTIEMIAFSLCCRSIGERQMVIDRPLSGRSFPVFLSQQ
jgi:hypothetical protein